jgi:hypothetical protein
VGFYVDELNVNFVRALREEFRKDILHLGGILNLTFHQTFRSYGPNYMRDLHMDLKFTLDTLIRGLPTFVEFRVEVGDSEFISDSYADIHEYLFQQARIRVGLATERGFSIADFYKRTGLHMISKVQLKNRKKNIRLETLLILLQRLAPELYLSISINFEKDYSKYRE